MRRTLAARHGSPTARAVAKHACTFMFLAAAVVLWPARLGGATSFVVVAGQSMEPTYHTGDVLLVRDSGHPQPGDIAVYRSTNGSIVDEHLVVHRVLGRTHDGRYTFQGDNRATADDDHPASRDIVGRPVANLGPLPSDLLAILPRFLAALVSVAVTIRLWPDEPKGRDEVYPIVGT
ncbi:MAG: signal peptidase I [Microthrixaceae bacterium]